LRPKTFAILRYLVEHPNRLVTKEEILCAVWGNIQVSAEGLRDYLREIRRALGDNAEAPRFVETVRGRGYRFLPAITTQPVQSSKFQDSSSPPLLVPSPQSLVSSAALPLPDQPSIIVLPFVNLSNDPEQEYFSDGITEDITNSLSRISSLFVISRTSAFTYKGKAVKVQDISKEMGVQYVLEGSVRRSETQVRITVQLIDAIADHHLWGERYDRELKDIFVLQEEISRKIIRYLAVRFTREEQGRLWSRSVTTPEAYDALLHGWALFRRGTKETNNQARRMFEHALELDPTYAEAYAAKGMTYWQAWWSQWHPDPQNLDSALALALKAKNLDDSSPLVHWLLAYVYVQKRQHEQAVAEAERLIALFPNSAWGYAALSLMLNFVGRPEEAVGWLEKAMRLDPHYPVLYLWTLGQAYRLMGRYKEAIAFQQRVLKVDPNYLPAHVHLASIYGELSLEKEAQAEVTEIFRLSPHFSMENIAQRLPYKNPVMLESFLAALRKAGLK